jgi:adenylate cyclase
MSVTSFLAELRRRKVLRVAAVYAATGFVVLQGADLILPGLLLPEWTYRLLVLLVLSGLPIALVLAWAFDITPQGILRTEPQATGDGAEAQGIAPALLGRRTALLAGALVAVGIGLGAGWFLKPAGVAHPDLSVPTQGPAAADRSLAVLPFTDLSEGGDQKWFAEGLAEEILTSLARLPELRVIGRNSSFLFADGALDDRVIADTLGVAHLVKGSVRRVGGELRVTAQLVRAADGVQLWSESYDRPAAALLDVQRDVAEKVADALDIYLSDERREHMFVSGTRNVEAFEAYLRGREIFAAAHAGEEGVTLAEANAWLEAAMVLDAGFAAPAFLYADRYAHMVVDGLGAPIVGKHDLTVQQALARLHEAFDRAARARDPQIRLLAQINRTFFSSDWRPLPGLLDAVDEHGATLAIDDPWGRHVAIVLGRHDLSRRLGEALVRWDPLSVPGWTQRIQVEFAAGDLPGAWALIAEARRAIPHSTWWDGRERLAAMLEGNRQGVLARLTPVEEWSGYADAVHGDAATARARAAAWEAAAGWPETHLLRVYYEIGDHEGARALAGRIDALPGGVVMLLRELSLNGAACTFDPADTPNFSARLREAGVDPASFRAMPRLSETPGSAP